MTPKSKPQQIVLITGTSRGIGYELAKLYGSLNYLTYATVRTLESATALKNLSLPNLKIAQMDITNDSEVNKVVNQIISEHGHIDILIGNAGKIVFGPIETVTINQAYKQFDVNVFGMMRLINAVAPHMREKKKGHIVFLGSSSGVECSPMFGIYSASKFALEALVYALACNLFPWNIGVSLIELNATATQITDKSLTLGANFKNQEDPYKTYTTKSLSLLKEIISNGTPPEKVAKYIKKITDKFKGNPRNQLRFMSSSSVESIYSSHLKDPLAKGWLNTAKEEWR